MTAAVWFDTEVTQDIEAIPLPMTARVRLSISRSWALAIATGLVIAVGILDYWSGREVQVVPLYLLPLALSVWRAGRTWGVIFSVLAAGTWLGAELATGPVTTHPLVPYWNALMFLMVFVSVTLTLSRLHDAMDSLERRVKARTDQLKDEMARRHDADLARFRAERLAAVGTMAAQLAHEVRNPMCSISLNVDLLSIEINALTSKESHSPAEANLLLSQIGREIGRIESVLRDYLTFARLPKIVLREQPVHAFLDERLALINAELAAAHVSVLKDYDPQVECMNADPPQMWQVILNLVRNAREAMPQGGEIKVHTRREGGEIEISVSDTGSGIEEEHLSQLFTPFFTTKAEGTGLGLALSQQIVAEHGGRIECRSTPGAGTTFSILLPQPNRSIMPYNIKADPIKYIPSKFHELQSSVSC
jgi:signal transduction histidine kinase